jgi:hypothetical protein
LLDLRLVVFSLHAACRATRAVAAIAQRHLISCILCRLRLSDFVAFLDITLSS